MIHATSGRFVVVGVVRATIEADSDVILLNSTHKLLLPIQSTYGLTIWPAKQVIIKL